MSQLDPRALRDAFGSFMTGVTVVTTHDKDDNPLGFTANSFTSVSLDPPLVLVCLANSSANYDVLVNNDRFAINVLCENQKEVSNTFARPVDDRFATVNWRQGPHGSPILDGVSAWFDCSSHKQVEAGDHVILIGRVEAFEATAVPGLGYARGAYVTPAMEAEAISQRSDIVVSALIEKSGEVFFHDDGNGNLSLPAARVDKSGATATLQTLIDRSEIDATPGFIYSVFDDTDHEQQHISFLCQATSDTTDKGDFLALTPSTLSSVSDSAVRIMLERFARESKLGNYGVYFGNQNSGEVRPILKES
ncbi:MAG: flavin reductase (DIM6/NTAB) family NADH-FMN oxidoreductase RutF [Gammaproteobacteria bacterium]|jgi:flavin reductase (DIM6/NTAB) family NADH-FMN oxidoreductase RutF